MKQVHGKAEFGRLGAPDVVLTLPGGGRSPESWAFMRRARAAATAATELAEASTHEDEEFRWDGDALVEWLATLESRFQPGYRVPAQQVEAAHAVIRNPTALNSARIGAAAALLASGDRRAQAALDWAAATSADGSFLDALRAVRERKLGIAHLRELRLTEVGDGGGARGSVLAAEGHRA